MYWVRRVAVWRVNLAWPTAHQIETGLFRALIDLVVDTKLHVICGPSKVVVVTINALCVDDHPRRQEQDAPRYYEVQPHLGLLYRVLVLGRLVGYRQRLYGVFE